MKPAVSEKQRFKLARSAGRRGGRAVGCVRLLIAAALLLGLAACDSSRSRPAKGTAPGESARPVLFRIHGNVQLQDGKDPTGVLVFCAGASYCALADSDGNYVISSVPAGTYVLIAQREAYERERVDDLTLDVSKATGPAPEVYVRSVELRPVAPPSDRDLPQGMAPGAGMLTGWVVLADKASPDGVRVELEGTHYSTASNSGGGFSLLGVEPGNYVALFSREGYNAASLPVTIQAGRVTRLADPVRLTPVAASEHAGPGILGKLLLLTASGQPVETVQGATVRIVENQRLVQAAQDGAFEFPNLEPGEYTLVAAAPGFTLDNPVTVTVVGEAQMVVLMLRESKTEENLKGGLTGVVQLGGAEKKSLAGTQVALAGTSHAGVTASDGRFTLDEIPEGTGVLICARQGYKTLEMPSVSILGGTITDLGVLTLEPEAVPPKVLSTDPADGARDVVIRPVVPVRLVFSKRMNLDSVRSALAIQPTCAFSVNRSGSSENPKAQDVLEVRISNDDPAAALRFKTRYQLTVGVGAADSEGLALEKSFAMTFTTAGLRFISSTPGQDARDGPVTSSNPVIIRFNGRVKKETLTPRNITFSPKPAAVGNIWGVQNDFKTGWTVLNLPLNLQHDTVYTVRFDTRIEAEDGTRLDSAGNALSFRTIARPTVAR